jgi:hypothetical protein
LRRNGRILTINCQVTIEKLSAHLARYNDDPFTRLFLALLRLLKRIENPPGNLTGAAAAATRIQVGQGRVAGTEVLFDSPLLGELERRDNAWCRNREKVAGYLKTTSDRPSSDPSTNTFIGHG